MSLLRARRPGPRPDHDGALDPSRPQVDPVNGLLLYCVSRTGADPAIAGVGGRPVRDLEVEGLRATVSTLDDRDWVTRPGPDALLAYDRVVAAAHRRGTALPLRYGLVADTADEVRRLVDARRPELETDLDRLDGCDEVGLCLSGTHRRADDDAVAGDAGRLYLLQCRRRFQAQEDAHAELRSAAEAWRAWLAGLCVSWHVGPLRPMPGGQRRCVWLYLLVRHERREAVAHRIEDGSPPLARLAARSGPGPPYHFASVPTEGRERRAATMAEAM